jgi:nucleotide-binding universal stress UspA family protein
MYNRILVALDGSQLSESVLPYACFLAKNLKIPVDLFRVVGPLVQKPTSTAERALSDDVRADTGKTFVDYLNGVADSFPDPSTVNCIVGAGDPAEAIVDSAAAQAGTLIIMATHGRSGVGRWLLGSVAEKVLQMINNPLLLVRGTHAPKTIEAPFKTVVVPLDGSALAEKALPHVSDMATKLDLEIALLRVYALPLVYRDAQRYYPPYPDQLLENVKEEAEKYLEQKAAQLKKDGLGQVSCASLEGDSAEQIIDFASKAPGAFIAMSTHGRSGIARLVLGSVTGRVVRHSGNPVLVIRSSTESSHDNRIGPDDDLCG